jgi:hypothetical protein
MSKLYCKCGRRKRFWNDVYDFDCDVCEEVKVIRWKWNKLCIFLFVLLMKGEIR